MDFEDRLNHFPEGWKPKVGDSLIGTVAEVSTRDSDYGGEYPVVVIETEDGREIAIHAFHTVLKNELARLRPREGDKLGVKCHGRDGGEYEKYRVLLERAEPEEAPAPDWTGMAEPDPDVQRDWSEPSDDSADAAL